jgi:hypothetical protein
MFFNVSSSLLDMTSNKNERKERKEKKREEKKKELTREEY